MWVILINSLTIFLQESGYDPFYIQLTDILCTLFFIVEMLLKMSDSGQKAYWLNAWDRFDGILVILSFPSLVTFFLPNTVFDLSSLLVLRLFRVFRFFRVMHFFPNFSVIMKNIGIAMRQSLSVFVGFIILLVIMGMLNCSIFGKIAPEYFQTPLDSIYTMFRLCTIEGWYEIPDAVAMAVGSTMWVHIVRVYFSVLLFAGGVIGLSIVNSIFVDAMVSDNNDDLMLLMHDMQKRLDEMQQQLTEALDKNNKQV